MRIGGDLVGVLDRCPGQENQVFLFAQVDHRLRRSVASVVAILHETTGVSHCASRSWASDTLDTPMWRILPWS